MKVDTNHTPINLPVAILGRPKKYSAKPKCIQFSFEIYYRQQIKVKHFHASYYRKKGLFDTV